MKMYKSGDTILYRDTPYTYQEWTTYSGKQAKGFNCNCENLLQYVNVVSFGTITEDEMHERIDDYLDNIEHHKELTRLHDEGCAAYYAEKRANGDNYTGD